MAQYCPHCKWYSADGLLDCSTCGRPFDLDDDEVDETEELEEEERPLLERIGWGLALAGGALVGVFTLYNRFVTADNMQAVGATLDRLSEALGGAGRAASSLLLGPNGEYKNFALILLGTSVVVWLVLWIMARLGRP